MKLKNLQNLIHWSRKHYAHLPWRQQRSLYTTLVSEVMLQQTTVGTVLNHFQSFLQRYPTLATLAQTDEKTLQIAWKGLGYYRRAKNLLKAAQYLQNEHQGHFPLQW